VLRPPEDQFNGTVIVEWINVSAGENFFLSEAAPQLVRDGFAVVGVSAQLEGVEGSQDSGATSPGPMPALKTSDPDRYASLVHPSDDYSFDIFSQAGRLLGRNRPDLSDPLRGLDVRHRIAVGVSQSSARLAGYLNGIHAEAPDFDAYLLVVYPQTPAAISADSAPAELPQTFGPNKFHILEWYKYLLRHDLGVPIIILNSESEASECEPNHQDDTEFVRWWEIPGTSHTGASSAERVVEIAKMVGTSVSFAPAMRGAFHALHRWLDSGEPPRHQPRLFKKGDPPRFHRDEHGNALEGIRWPDVEAPLATHSAERIEGDESSLLRGTSIPFTPEKIRALYPTHAEWFAKYEGAVERLVGAGVILPDDGDALIIKARTQPLP
jgi:hypothetical protein